MNFIVSSSSLLKQIRTLSSLPSPSSSIPIQEDFLFEIEPGTLSVFATDSETMVKTSFPIEAKMKGAIAIPSKPLMETLLNFPEQPLAFSVEKDTFLVRISTDNGEYKISGHDPDAFPRFPVLDSTQSMTMKSDVLSTAIAKTLFAVSNDDLRPMMCGVFCQFDENDCVFVATDAHKLVRYRRLDSHVSSAASFILPKKPLSLLRNLLADTDEVVNIEFNKSNASFAFGRSMLVCRLIDGKYPNYEAVIPKSNPNKLIIDRESLVGALKRMNVYSNRVTHQVRLKLTGSQMDISAEDIDYANAANERLTCNYSGEDMEIGFNSKFLLEVLQNIEDTELQLEMSAPSRAGIITSPKNTNKAEDLLMLVMPVMLGN